MYDTSASEIRNLKYPKIQNMTSYEFHDFVTYNLEEVLATLDISVTNQIHYNSHNPLFIQALYFNWKTFMLIHP